jgi:hypothetical protein
MIKKETAEEIASITEELQNANECLSAGGMTASVVVTISNDMGIFTEYIFPLEPITLKILITTIRDLHRERLEELNTLAVQEAQDA